MIQNNLDDAIRSFRAWCEGKDGFDELDLKEWLIESWQKPDSIAATMEGITQTRGVRKFALKHNKLKDKQGIWVSRVTVESPLDYEYSAFADTPIESVNKLARKLEEAGYGTKYWG